MSGHGELPSRWQRSPSGESARRWRTVPFERTVLVVARGPTTTLWMFDFLDEVLADDRIQVVFTVDEHRPDTFSRGLTDISPVADAVVIPWSQAVSEHFDLAVCASFEGSLDQLGCPLLLGMHGASIGKKGALPQGGRFSAPAGLDPLSGGAATTVMLSHRYERRLLDPIQPGVEVVVVGDPCLDRLQASVPQRDLYRRDLGLRPSQRLVTVSSTWGPEAILANAPDIGIRLASELPADSYRVALIVHPNIWTAHGLWQVRTWTKRANDAGVLAIPPWQNSWRSALVASDAVIHDHGSVGLYAAALGLPVMSAAQESGDTIDDAPIAHLNRLAPPLDLGAPLRAQIDGAVRDHSPDRYATVAERVSGEPGRALEHHRDVIYRLIGLEPPGFQPRTLAMPPPPEPLPPIYSHHVRTSVGSVAEVGVERFPAMAPPPPARADRIPGRQRLRQHNLVCDVREPDTRLPHNAAIVFDSAGLHTPGELLQRYPGCRYAIAAASGRAVALWHSGGSRFELRPLTPSATAGPSAPDPAVSDPAIADLSVFASAAYALETAGHDLRRVGEFAAVLDGRRMHCTLERHG